MQQGMHYILSSIYIAPPLVHFPNLYNRKHMNSKWPAIHRQASMAKATKLFLSSVILLLYTSLHIQGLYYHLNSMHVLYIHHGKLHHQDVPDCPLLLIYYFTYGIYMLCTCDKQVRVQQSTVMSRNTSTSSPLKKGYYVPHALVALGKDRQTATQRIIAAFS